MLATKILSLQSHICYSASGAGSASPPPPTDPTPQHSTTLPSGSSVDPDALVAPALPAPDALVAPAPRRRSSSNPQGPVEDSDSDANAEYLHPPTKFLNQKASEMKRKSQKAKENFNKNGLRAVGLGLLSVIIGIGVFSPYNGAGDTLIKLIASQAPIAVGFTTLGLILPVLGMVYCGLKAIKNNRDKVRFKRGSESITIESQIYESSKGKNLTRENVEQESRQWQDRIRNAESKSRSSSRD